MAGLSCGVVGLPNVGKSTLFNAITSSQAPASNYPFCTIEPNKGIVEVIDPKLQVLSKMSKSEKIIYATTEILDIAGLVKGASQGEGLGNAFLSNIRNTDAIIHVVRCFEGDDVIHVDGSIDPIRDIEVINLELILSDLASIQKSLEKVEKQAKSDKTLNDTVHCLKKALQHLDDEKPLRTLELSSEEQEILDTYAFITTKKVLYAANVGEEDLPLMENAYVKLVREFAKNEGSAVITICAKLEEEIAQIDDPEERDEFLKSVGLEESGLQRLVHASFDMLGLTTFITSGEKETRAWTIKKGMTAQEAAGKIHSDIARGFIRAEVITFDDFVSYGGRVKVKEAGKMRSEGREYIVQPNDIILFLNS